MTLLLLSCAACERDSDWRSPAVSLAAESKAEAAYLAPPVVTSGAPSPQGVVLRGRAAAGSRVRLVTPQGEALFAQTDGEGAWTLVLPPADAARLYGLSMTMAERTVQAEGYLAVLPPGRVVWLRAGAGALPVVEHAPGLKITAVDFDRDGGAIVSGVTAPGAAVSLRIDGLESRSEADAAGRFSVAASQPLSPQPHQIVVVGDGQASLTVDASRAAPLEAAPLRAQKVASGWRIDWMTPGGGVQTTLIPGA